LSYPVAHLRVKSVISTSLITFSRTTFGCLLSIPTATAGCLILTLKTTADVKGKIQKSILVAEYCTGRKVIFIHSDQGTEFINSELNSFFLENGIQLETTVAYEHHQNLIEHGWRSMFNTEQAWITTSDLPLSLWTYAAGAYDYIHNHTIQSDGKMPYYAL